MDGNPAGDGPAKPRRSRPPAADEMSPAERVGPLAVRRMAKADGRSLIVYERVDPGLGSDARAAGGRGARE